MTEFREDSDNPQKRKKPRHRAVPLVPEVRHFAAKGLEVRDAGGDGNTVTVTGLPIVYDVGYRVIDHFGEFEERMLPGVATEVMGADVRFLIDHEGMALARTASGTLRLEERDNGLGISADLDTRQSVANDLLVAIERGDVSQMSVGFVVARDEWNDEMDQRTIHQFAELLDVSAVTYPASPTTSLQLAKRTALRMQVESRARLRKIDADLRAGKRISAATESLITDAINTLNAVINVNPTDAAVADGLGSPDDDGKGAVLPDEPTDEFDNDGDGNDQNNLPDDDRDGMNPEPDMDPGEPIQRSKPSPELLTAVRERHGRRLSQQHRESEDLLREAKRRIV